MSSPEHKQLIWNLIKDIKVGMLVTQDNQTSMMHGRPMHLVQDAYDGSLYFYTSKNAAKVNAIEEDRGVCVTFSKPEDQVYVSLSGVASITEDRDLIDRYWSPWVEAWFEGGKDDPDLAIMKVKIVEGEHWDTKENKLVQLFKIAKANVLDEQPELGEHAKF